MKLMFWRILALAGLALQAGGASLDPSFRSAHPPILRGPDGPVFASAEASGGAVVIAGDFERVNGTRRHAIARLRPDGTLDVGFDPATGPDGAIRTVAVGTDGSVVVGGGFRTWGGSPADGHLVRLAADGSRDGDFAAGPAWEGEVVQILALPGGGFWVLGWQQVGEETRSVLQRRLADGGLDTTYTPQIPAGASLNALARAADGSVLVVGRFNEFDGQALTNVVRLLPEGGVDASFRPPAAGEADEWHGVAFAGDGRIALGGVGTNIFPQTALVVLQANGQTDPAFAKPATLFQPLTRVTFDGSGNLLVAERWPGSPGFESLYQISASGAASPLPFEGALGGAAPLLRSDGRVLWALDGLTVAGNEVWNGLLETLPDGSVNPQFNPGQGQDAELWSPVRVLALLPDGDLVVRGTAGIRTNLTTGEVAFQQDLVRLDLAGELRTGFSAAASALGYAFNVLIGTDDTRILAAGSFASINWDRTSPLIASLNGDGSRDPAFTSTLKAPTEFHFTSINDADRLPDGRVLVGGNFEFGSTPSFSADVLCARFLPNGSLDPSFKPLTAARVRSNAYILRVLAWDAERSIIWGRIGETGPPALYRYTAAGELASGPLLERADGQPAAVFALIRQVDGGILVAGNFDTVGGVPRRNLVRLRADLSLDPDFSVGRGPNGVVFAVAALSDGRILVGGHFTRWNDESFRRLVLLRPEGSPDPAFNLGTGPDDDVYQLKEQPDGRVLVGGRFGQVDGQGSPRLVRINLPPLEPRIPAHLVAQPPSVIVTRLAGPVTLRAGAEGTPPLRWQWFRNGVPLAAADGFTGVAAAELVIPSRHLADAAVYHVEVSNDTGRERSATAVVGFASGTMEPGFTTNALTGGLRLGGVTGLNPITGLIADRDAAGRAGRILIVGTFGQYDGQPAPGLVVVHPDGSRDLQWNPPAGVTGAETAKAAFRPDGRLVLVGKFNRTRGAPRDVVMQLKPDGSLDESFDAGDELAVTPPAGFPKQTAAVGLALDGDGLFVSSQPGAPGLPNGFIRRMDSAGRTDLAFVATNAVFLGPPSVLSVEPSPDGGLLVGGSLFAAQLRQGPATLFRGVVRFRRDGRIDTNYNAKPRRPDNSASGDVNALIPLADGHAWVAGTFTEFDRAPGPLVWLDDSGIADTNFVVRLPSESPVIFPGRNLLGASLRSDGDLLLNYRPVVKGADSIVRMGHDGVVLATAGGPVESYRTSGPVLDLGDGSYLTPITVKSANPITSSPAVGRFWLSRLAGAPSTNLPPVLLAAPADLTLSRRPGYREPLVLSAVIQENGDLRFRWFFNDTLLAGQTNSVLIISDPQPSHSGRYRLEAANAVDTVVAEVMATVVAAPPEPPRLTVEWTSGERPLRLRFAPLPGYRYGLESSGDLSSWIAVDDPGALISPAEFAPSVGPGPGYYRLIQEP